MNENPLYIYLDQNQWIYLAQADHNHQEGEEYKEVLRRLEKLVAEDKIRLPLSAYHFLETQKNRDNEQKAKLAETISKLSVGWGMALLDKVTPAEIQIAGAKIFKLPLPSQPKVFERDLSLVWDIDLHALARGIAKENNEPIASSEAFISFFKRLLATPEMTKLFLTGDIIEKTRMAKALVGYKLGISDFARLNESVRSKVKLTAKSQLLQKRKIVSDYVRGKETEQIYNDALSVFGKSIADVIYMGEDKIVEFIESIPTLDLETELVAMRNVQWDRAIDENDWADIRYLVVAIPYCDFVVTENIWHDLIRRRKLDKKYKTTVLKNVSQLIDYI